MGEHPSLDLLAAAEMIGGYRWLEHRLFEITGAWSAQAHDPGVRLHLFEASHQHAWHAQLWADRLPQLDQLDPEALSVPYGPAAGSLIDALGAVGSSAAPPTPARATRHVVATATVTGNEVATGTARTRSAPTWRV